MRAVGEADAEVLGVIQEAPEGRAEEGKRVRDSNSDGSSSRFLPRPILSVPATTESIRAGGDSGCRQGPRELNE